MGGENKNLAQQGMRREYEERRPQGRKRIRRRTRGVEKLLAHLADLTRANGPLCIYGAARISRERAAVTPRIRRMRVAGASELAHVRPLRTEPAN